MPEQNEYFDKFLEARFAHIDASVQNISNAVNDLKGQFVDLKGQFVDLRNDVKEENEATRADNKATRRWIFGTVVGTGITVLLGLAAILLTFVQIQNSWMQQVISFASKMIVK
jgi:uncharacterized membrane protein YcjF (UPF0283 family)